MPNFATLLTKQTSGLFNANRTVFGLTMSMRSMPASMPLIGCGIAMIRSKLNFTSSAVIRVPSENFTPGRSVNVIDFASGANTQRVASPGRSRIVPCTSSTSAS